MNSIRKGGWFVVILCGFLILTVTAACTKKGKMAEQGIQPQEQMSLPGETFPEAMSSVRESELERHITTGELGHVFFDFDQVLIRPDGRRVLEENARWLKQNGNRRIVIEGHADERGTTEYNLVS